jgi:acyl-CoA synthetase (AMP-forming)/AMP-acid ligase II
MNNLLLLSNRQKVQNIEIIKVQGSNYYPQAIEKSLKQSHPSLRPNAGVVFSIEVDYQERLVVLQEVKKTYSRILNVTEVIKAIRAAALEEHGLQVYTVVLLKTGSLPKDSHGKIDRDSCRDLFLNTNFDSLHTWTVKPQEDLQQLQIDVNTLLENVQMLAQQAQFKVS